MRIDDLVKQLPPDNKQRVEEAKRRFNLMIREAIRAETRFSLAGATNGEPGSDREDAGRQSVAVRIEPGLPQAWEYLEIPAAHVLSARMWMIRGALLRLRDSARVVATFLADHQELSALNPFVGGGICYSAGEADELIALMGDFSLPQFLLHVNEDVLGIYSSRLGSHHADYRGPQSVAQGQITLYAGAIGLTAAMLDVAVEDLTCVVLTHEMAHAYTHLGQDIDAVCWSATGWAESDIHVIECVAQYYTERVLTRLRPRVPGAFASYEELLKYQASPYTIHRQWTEVLGAGPESLRATLVRLRHLDRGLSIGEFRHVLEESCRQIEGRRQRRALTEGTV